MDRPSKTTPPAESIFSGALLKEKMPRFAHSRFFRRLFVLSPNIALRPDIIHPGLTEADVGSQSSEKQISLRAAQQPAHNSSIDQRKITGVDGES